ncbi:MAG: cation diffusion facilitator family transporter [Alkalispirochaetaceae bacterium]
MGSHEHHGHDHHEHHHALGHTHSHHHGSGSIAVAFALNLLFAAVELVGGLLTNSVAILSDAIHDIGDATTLGVAWYLERLSRGRRTGRLTYGFRRYSLLGALVSGIILLLGSTVILLEAIPRLFHPEPVDPLGMIALAVLGLLFNGAAVFRLRRDESTNSRMVMLHLLEDLLGWAAVLVGSILIYFFGITWLDPVLSIGVTLFVLAQAIPRLLEVGRLFMQYAPPEIELDELSRAMSEHPLVSEVHDLHLWSLDGRYTLLTAHLVAARNDPPPTLEELDTLRADLKRTLATLGVDHATLEVEGPDAACAGCDL